jgi:hypothetical protein
MNTLPPSYIRQKLLHKLITKPLKLNELEKSQIPFNTRRSAYHFISRTIDFQCVMTRSAPNFDAEQAKKIRS